MSEIRRRAKDAVKYDWVEIGMLWGLQLYA